ncbi:hypothetical protein GALMADRAFT_251721 [Galerina marginata CBS 339.88]|uniref:G-protein coupled receptors family 1 profile domain-containing protein n=1 Tax=Galerina marginata (strain CBS 339.88) TaxID=685588 RepID=A0A067SSW8_GALM3|nr:hypothetical protein GALMADRAFT_251721 [Galerina marginata CBS 339.88]
MARFLTYKYVASSSPRNNLETPSPALPTLRIRKIMTTPSDLNPTPSILDPSAYLPPVLNFELTIETYVSIAALVVQIWDMLNNVNADYKLLTRHQLRLPTIVYFISRFSTLAYMLMVTIFETASIGDCEKLYKLIPWLFCIAMPSTSLLFFFRVTAMYSDYKSVVAFFFLMWLGILAGGVTSVLSVLSDAGSNIGPTRRCIGGTMKTFIWTGIIVPLVNDSLIFFAISFRLMLVGLGERVRIRDAVKVIIFGKDLPAFSKALLRDGQAYYLTTLGLTFTTTIIFFIQSMPIVYRTILAMPNFTVINIMACRVYRRTKSGVYRENNGVELRLPVSFRESSRRADFAGGLQPVH